MCNFLFGGRIKFYYYTSKSRSAAQGGFRDLHATSLPSLPLQIPEQDFQDF